MNAGEILQVLYDAGAETETAMCDALCDGAALLEIGVTDEDQAAVEQAHWMVSESDIDSHLANGGTIGNYQW